MLRPPQRLWSCYRLLAQEVDFFLSGGVAPKENFVDSVHLLANFRGKHGALHDVGRNGNGDGVYEGNTAS